ncbi:MAG TPA: hypothetical protein VKD19_09630 [Pseudolabrys sp.]|nr:hypothetical protein [Pseudolabrys sp.]
MKSVLTAVLMLFFVPAALAQDHSPAQMPVDAKLVTGNEFVQVLRISIPAHARTPMHEVTPRVVIWLSDAHFVDRYADGTVREETRNAGDAEWVSARRHSGENLADKPMEFIAVVVARAGVR